jgi:hypothetical protein
MISIRTPSGLSFSIMASGVGPVKRPAAREGDLPD